MVSLGTMTQHLLVQDLKRVQRKCHREQTDWCMPKSMGGSWENGTCSPALHRTSQAGEGRLQDWKKLEGRSYKKAASSDAQRDARGQGAETEEAQLPTHLKASYDSVSLEPITHLANSKLGEPWEPGCLALTTMSNDLCEVTLRGKWGSSETEIQTANRHQGGWAGGSGHQQNESPGFGSQGFLWL